MGSCCRAHLRWHSHSDFLAWFRYSYNLGFKTLEANDTTGGPSKDVSFLLYFRTLGSTVVTVLRRNVTLIATAYAFATTRLDADLLGFMHFSVDMPKRLYTLSERHS